MTAKKTNTLRPSKNKKHDKSQMSSREDLLRAGKSVFAELGYDRATVKDLADRAQVNIGAVSYHFGGKQALYESCLKDFAQLQMGFADRFLKSPTSVDDFRLRLRLFSEEFIQLHLKEPDLCRILHRDFEAKNPVAIKVFKTSFFPIYRSLESFVAAAKKMKILRADLEPQLSAFFIFGMLIHIVKADPMRKEMRGNSVTKAKDLETTLDYFINISLSGVLSEDKRGLK